MLSDHEYKLLFKEMMSVTNEGFIVIDANGVVQDISDVYCDFLDRPYHEIVGRPIEESISTTSMYDVLKNRIRGDGTEGVYIQPYSKDDNKSKKNVKAAANRFCFFDERGNLLGAAASVYFKERTEEMNNSLVQEELQYYKEAYQNQDTPMGTASGILGTDPQMEELRRKVFRIAKNDFPVLITGETGTGKEIIARAIHNESNRRKKPMIAINCAAIPEQLLESELFGYADGAFTGAKKGGKPGKFQLADGGSLFLDEIGDMPLALQAKLLRVLQEQEVEKIGGTHPEKVDVRVIAATRQNLVEMVARGQFREDLYYRLNVIGLQTVPLRDHPDDILLYASHTLDELNRKYKTKIILSDAAAQRMREYSWPGNVRELINVITSAYASCDSILIGEVNLPSKLVSSPLPDVSGKPGRKLRDIIIDYESAIIRDCLRRNQYNCSATARELGIDRSLLYRKMERSGIILERSMISRPS